MRLNLEGIELLYVYGLKGDPLVDTFLAQDPRNTVVFLEDTLESFEGLFQENPQIHVRLILSEELIDECCTTFASEKVEVVTFDPTKAEKIDELRLKILRKSALFYALVSEALHLPYLIHNCLSNFFRLHHAFPACELTGKFSGIPAIICGAGPSLAASFEPLKALRDKALVFAGGSAISALCHAGIIPDFGMAVDPNPEEYDRFKHIAHRAFPLLYANRLFPAVFTACDGPWGYLYTDRASPFEMWLEEEIGIKGERLGSDVDQEALSVTTLLIAYAVRLGCHPIILTGVDLAYTGGKRYAPGIVEEEPEVKAARKAGDLLLERIGHLGHTITTQVKWVMEASVIAAFAKSHPYIEMMNATEDGLPIEGLKRIKLQEFACEKVFDFKKMIQEAIEALPAVVSSSELLFEPLERLTLSLERCQKICQAMVEELEATIPFYKTGKMVILEMDFEEELAFKVMLQNLAPAFERSVGRTVFDEGERVLAIWKFLKKSILDLQQLFQTGSLKCLSSQLEFVD